MGRSPCCDKSKVKRGSWSPDEDAILKNYIHNHGIAVNWIALPHKAGLQRCGKSCRLRWLNYLRPNLKHGAFTQDEQNIISTLYTKVGSRWSVIASHLPGRTDNDVKNYWNTKMKKKLVPVKSNTKPDASIAAAATTPTKTLDKTTNIEASPDLLALPPTFPMPFSTYDDFTLPRFVLEGHSSNCSSGNRSCSFSPSRQESSLFGPFSLGVDENYGVNNKGILMDDFSSYEVMNGVWCQEEEGIGADNNADLFSIFNDHSEPRGASQSQYWSSC